MLVEFITIALKSNNFFQIEKHLNFQQITQLLKLNTTNHQKNERKNLSPKKKGKNRQQWSILRKEERKVRER